MCNENKSRDCNCIAEILKVILILQNNACGPENCLDTCDRPALGSGSCVWFNTRPITFYTCCGNGTPWSMPTSKNTTDCSGSAEGCSSVFRIEKLDECCATCRVLIPNPEPTPTEPYLSTDSFFTINLNCVCAIKCLNDCFICL